MRDIIIGSDNAGVELKKIIIEYLSSKNVSVTDVGVASEQDETYYPYIAKRVCEAVIKSGYQKRGILICGTGIGMCMTANEFRGIRAAVCHDIYSARRSILSNDGNVLCIGARVVGTELAKTIAEEWIGLEFVDGPSTPKVKAIIEIEQENFLVGGINEK